MIVFREITLCSEPFKVKQLSWRQELGEHLEQVAEMVNKLLRAFLLHEESAFSSGRYLCCSVPRSFKGGDFFLRLKSRKACLRPPSGGFGGEPYHFCSWEGLGLWALPE